MPELAAAADLTPPTMRDLLRHTSGLPRDFAPPSFSHADLPPPAAARACIAGLRQGFAAGTRAKYSNATYALLGEAIAAAGGTAYAEYIARSVAAPIGLVETEVVVGAPPDGVAAGYAAGPLAPVAARRLHWADVGVLAAAGGAVATVGDGARLANFLLGHGPAPLHPATRREMLRSQWHDDATGIDHGLGIFAAQQGDLRTLQHFGLLGGHASAIVVWPERDLGAVVLTNDANGAPGAYARQALALLRAAQDGTLPRYVPTEANASPPPSPVVGDYGFDAVRQLVVQRGDALYMVAPGEDDGWQHAARLWPVEPTQLRLDGGPWHGEVLTLHGPAGEAPTAISVGGICWPRLAPP